MSLYTVKERTNVPICGITVRMCGVSSLISVEGAGSLADYVYISRR